MKLRSRLALSVGGYLTIQGFASLLVVIYNHSTNFIINFIPSAMIWFGIWILSYAFEEEKISELKKSTHNNKKGGFR